MTTKWITLLALALALTACQKEQVKEGTEKADGVAEDVKAMRKMMETEEGRRKISELEYQALLKVQRCSILLPIDRQPKATDCAAEQAHLDEIRKIRKEQR